MKKVVTFGEILLRLSPPGFQRFSQARQFEVEYGGAELNVAASLAHFGLPAKVVSRVPDNAIGASALMELRKHGVDASQVLLGGKRLGIYYLETGAVARGSKVVYDREDSSMATIEKGMVDWASVFQDASWFHWTGITPAISQGAADVCQEAIAMANKMGLTVSTDMNIRKNLWQYGKQPEEVMPGLVAGCDIVVCSKGDAVKYLGVDRAVTEDLASRPEVYAAVGKALQKLYPRVQKFVTTVRGSINASHNTWSGLLYNGTNVVESKEYAITHIVDRVGGGDSFTAALIYGLITYSDDQRALDFAVAASCLKHTIPGDVNLVTVEEVENLLASDGSGKIVR